MRDMTLEKHRFFPYIAWGIVCGFTFFVYTLIIELQAVTADLGAQTAQTEMQVQQATTNIPLN